MAGHSQTRILGLQVVNLINQAPLSRDKHDDYDNISKYLPTIHEVIAEKLQALPS